MSDRKVQRVGTLRGSVRVPGDKSASHRAVLLSAVGDGKSTIEGLSSGDDVRCTLEIVQQLGATVSSGGDIHEIIGPSEGLRSSESVLDCGNSGTAMRLVAGLLAGVPGTHTLVGDSSLSKRPMGRVIEPLRLMGANISAVDDELAPLRIEGSHSLVGISYDVPKPSAQVKSAILLAALSADGETTVHEAIRTRTSTETMLQQALVSVEIRNEGVGRSVVLHPSRPIPRHWVIPGDPSQAAFFAVLGLIHNNASIGVVRVLDEPERTGFLNVLQRMGGNIELQRRDNHSALRIRSSFLRGTEVHSSEIPSVDEVPILTVAAAAAVGVTRFIEMSELRVKESDRFSGSMMLAAALGCETWAEGDDFFVRGLGSANNFQNFSIDAGLDHRLVMSAAVAASAGHGGTINNWETVASSYPDFFEDLSSIQ